MTEPHYSDANVTLLHGDCLDILPTLPDCSVDAVVCDPPYGLEFMGKEWDRFDRRGHASFVNSEPPMGREKTATARGGGHSPVEDKPRWGNIGPAARAHFQQWCEEWARECLRALKPGGHLLAFGGTRTWHRLAVAVEDAGFEIRDSIAWLYGSGFPKSLDVSKAIDARARVNDETKRRIALVAEVIRTHREAKGMERAEVSQAVVGTPSGACWNWEHQQLPSVEMWPAIKRVLSIPDEFDGLVEGDRAQFIAAERAVVGLQRNAMSGWSMDGSTRFVDRDITAPATEAAQQWAGWGTALKPAHEPIVVARKPLAGTVAGNVLQHGTGALNIDGCRIAGQAQPFGNGTRRTAGIMGESEPRGAWESDKSGRWPANVVLDSDSAELLDQQSGEVSFNPAGQFGVTKTTGSDIYGNGKGIARAGLPVSGYGDRGGASRFFYTAKADSAERPTHNGIAHPTVKPLDLMRWLVRLVTPPGGTVLEPFAGSGTTVEAALLEGLRCIAIEREADYLPLILQRIHRRRDPVAYLTNKGEDLGLFEEPA